MEFSFDLDRTDEVQVVIFVGPPAQRYKVISVRVSSIESRITKYMGNLLSAFYSSTNIGSIFLQVAIVKNVSDRPALNLREELKDKVSKVSATLSKAELESAPFQNLNLGRFWVRNYTYWVETGELRPEESP